MFKITTENMNELSLEELDSVFDQVYPMEPIRRDEPKRKRSDSNNSIIFKRNLKSKNQSEPIDDYLDLKDLDDLVVKASSDPLPLAKLYTVKDLENPKKPINVWRSTINGVSVYITWLSPAGNLSKSDSKNVPLLRRADNSLVNASLLLHAAGLSEKEKSLICSFERKVRCSNKESPFYGIWIPLKRARTLAISLCLVKIDIFLSDQLSDYFSPLKVIKNEDKDKSKDLLNHLITKLSQIKNSDQNSNFINGIASLLPGLLAKSKPVTSINSLVSALNQLLHKPKPKKRIIIQDSD
jgi:hypothetical protein